MAHGTCAQCSNAKARILYFLAFLLAVLASGVTGEAACAADEPAVDEPADAEAGEAETEGRTRRLSEASSS